MHPISPRPILAAGLALGLSGLGLSSLSATAAGLPSFHPGKALYDAGVRSSVSSAQAASIAAASSSFPQFKAKVVVGTTSYTYVMAGKNPAVAHTNAASTIRVSLVPLVIKFANGALWDPTKIDSCDAGASALTRTQQSPLFVSQSWTWGGTAVGSGQVTDAFQRAEFWKYAQPGGLNASYAVNFALSTLKPITISVPAAQSAISSIRCGNRLLGAININWLDPYLQSTVIPGLAAQGVGPATVPLFVVHNVVEYITTTSQCCVLGYHNAYSTSNGVQTYALSMYDNSRAFAGSSDVSALSHELGEWQNDPYGNNPTPSWGKIGQVSGCQSNLEVGDPLSGTTFPDTVSGFTYHPQELAFFSWFYHQSPSLGVNGWYSDQGTFKTFAANCA